MMAMRLVVAGLAAFALLMPLHSGARAQSASTPQIRVPIDQAPHLAPNLKRSDDADDDQSSGSGAQIDSAGQCTHEACNTMCRNSADRGGCYVFCRRGGC
jgi:hypothetical protein